MTAPGRGEVTVVTDETLAEKDPLLAKLLAAATAGMQPAGLQGTFAGQPKVLGENLQAP